ncbi:hypothetical protein GCM10011367_24260 [Marinicauda pacifica]|uniref:TnsA endonuclease N-terminal domain-containing protein n=1 Tax=Marinicauda pacifica TaxID=1133559 RepID=A0A4S2H9L9_9PROT|nr:TnsA endonuclease N-terminal domain-containing protein [Marinicauda pacifica]TGY92403.1 hypothetical protein E5162_12210 [Marinicauda pacifica]GGE48595.1 hypothetical protein GCM10011367_24260 [Marinicauda pacifica]
MELLARHIESRDPAIPPAIMSHYPDYAPVRKLVTGRRAQPTGLFPSVKNGRGMEYESSGERFGFWQAEVETRVRHYFEQPFTLKWIEAGKRREYTPDRLEERTSGWTVIEMKYSAEKKFDADYTQKLEVASALLAKIGMRFEVDTAERLKTSPEFPAIEEIVYSASFVVDQFERVEVAEYLKRRETSSVGELAELLGGGVDGRARLLSLVPRRVIALELDGEVKIDTPVSLAEVGLGYVS